MVWGSHGGGFEASSAVRIGGDGGKVDGEGLGEGVWSEKYLFYVGG